MRRTKKVYIVLLMLSLLLAVLISRSGALANYERLYDVTLLHGERISNEIQRAVYATEILKEVTRSEGGNITQERFNSLAHAVGDGLDYIVIQTMPMGIVEYAYPLAGNEETIGHNVIVSDTTAVESQMAINEQRFILSGPFDLLQGVKGIAIRNPLFIEEDFWGFLTIVLPVPASIEKTGILELEKIGYQYKLVAQYKNENILFTESSDFNEKHALTLPITIGGNMWSLSMYREDDVGYLLKNSLLLGALFILISTGIYFGLKKIEHTLENDPLTGAYNRRFLDTYMKGNPMAVKGGFALFYIDLNEFKPVNDIYGHEMGDRLLIAFVKRLQSNIKSDGLLFRIGGDEFILLVPSLIVEKNVKEMIQRISNLAQKNFTIKGQTIKISAGIGYACYPAEGDDIKSLMELADSRMYSDKEAYKKAHNITR